ncbi:hypothetical protein MMC20_000629 [Loxospora ochrophaea]|nr:hypothetical protein [Loxospora ochrophaea]
MTATVDALPADVSADPDAQSTVNDFSDYTQYLSSDLIRSLTLVSKLDDSYLSSTDNVHKLSTTYGALPSLSTSENSNTSQLRYRISQHLDFALNARESSYAEASRLFDVVDRHFNRLASISSKLKALPKPPSRDPTPVPQVRSPQISRTRRKGDTEGTPPPRITLRLDNARAAAAAGRGPAPMQRPRHRSRKVTVPGEVLPPPNPDSPPPSTESEWESEPPSPIPMPTSRVGVPSSNRSTNPIRIRLPKSPKPSKTRLPKTSRPSRPPRPPGSMGTNVHSAVAGISTSNALSLLSPPPPDAKPGSDHAPWMRLTEWEMAKLRKRMKKNAIWSPSETMIRRELSEAGRGPENYRAAKAKADANGEEFLDEDNIATTAPGKPLVPGEISADSLGLGETKLSNRGMKLNQAKKLKREIMAREQAALLAAAEIDQAGKRLGDIGSTFRNLFSKGTEESPENVSTNGLVNGKEDQKDRDPGKTPKKRKRETTPKVDNDQAEGEAITSPTRPAPKQRKIAAQPTPAPVDTSININGTPSANNNTMITTIPLAAPAPSPQRSSNSLAHPISPIESRKPTAASSRPRRPSLTLKGPAPPPEPVHTASRPASRAASRRASTGPPPESATREHLRRGSATPAPTPVATAASRRSRRPAPGPVTSLQDGGAAVSVGKRKNAPRKRGTAAAANAARKAADDNVRDKEEEVKAEEDAAGEEIDPDEARYCLCGDVSFGNMICCENSEVRCSSTLLTQLIMGAVRA